MFDRFTESARRVMMLAQEEARLLGHSLIGTEHLLLGLIAEGEGVASRALDRLGVTLEAVREKVAADPSPVQDMPSGSLEFSAPAKAALELSLRESLHLGHSFIGTEHLLLGLIRESHNSATRILADLGVEPSGARRRVIEQLVGHHESWADSTPPRRAGQRAHAGPGPQSTGLPLTPRARKILDEAARQAQGLGRTFVGVEHLVLAVLDEGGSVPAQVISAMGLTDAIRAKLIEVMAAQPTHPSNSVVDEDANVLGYQVGEGTEQFRLMSLEGKTLHLGVEDGTQLFAVDDSGSRQVPIPFALAPLLVAQDEAGRPVVIIDEHGNHPGTP